MKKYFYEETGMYIDWDQLKKLPPIDTFVDVGVGPNGSPELYKLFKDSKLILIDPLSESEDYIKKELSQRDLSYYKVAVGDSKSKLKINVEQELGRSTLLNVTDINFEGDNIDQREIDVMELDHLIEQENNLGKIGIKIDTEGYELKVIKGATKTLKSTSFVLAETRHNHETFEGMYKLHEFVDIMHQNNFLLSMIVTAKPFIADLVFQPKSDLIK